MMLLLRVLILCTLGSVISSRSLALTTNFLPLFNAYATKLGHVPLIKDDKSGFYVNVDLADDKNDASDSIPGPDTVPMILSLYTSHSLLVNDCLNFSSYNCDFYSCVPHKNDTFSLDFLDFTAAGYYADANIFLDYGNWKLTSKAAMADICLSGREADYSASKNGVIGMGVAENSQNNYMIHPIFSIFIDSDGSRGKLLFSQDMKMANTDIPPITIQADSNWNINATGNIQIGSSRIAINSTVIFELSASTIGFPLPIYQQIIKNIESIASMSCSSLLSSPTCTYNGDITSLPTISLSHENRNITIPSQVYAKQTENLNNIVLGLRGLASNLTGDSYVSPSHDNFIVLDSTFMAYYYVVFNAVADPTITLYIASEPTKSQTWLYLVLECVGIALLLAICIGSYCCLKKKKAKTTSSTMMKLVSPKVSNQIPLIKKVTSNEFQGKEIIVLTNGNAGAQYQEEEEEPEIFRKIASE